MPDILEQTPRISGTFEPVTLGKKRSDDWYSMQRESTSEDQDAWTAKRVLSLTRKTSHITAAVIQTSNQALRKSSLGLAGLYGQLQRHEVADRKDGDGLFSGGVTLTPFAW
ncbi:hypothetical protein E4U51_000981, partial [Claviceps purpurea]